MEQQLSLLDQPELQTEEEVAMCRMEAHESDGTLVCGVYKRVQGAGEPLVTGKYHGKKALACMRYAFQEYKPTEVL